jgi:hypothetical protein
VACLAYELGKRGLLVEQQKAVPLVYEEVKLDCPDDSQMTPVTEGALPDSGVVPNRLATGRELPLRELWRGCPRRLHTTKGTGDLNLFTFSDKIKQDAESRRWQVVCSRRGCCAPLLTICYAPSALLAK